MIKSIKVRNYLNKEITLELTRPELSGLIVKSVEGLGPAKANINVTDISTNDGGLFNSSRLILLASISAISSAFLATSD